jgi:hypothetical protein
MPQYQGACPLQLQFLHRLVARNWRTRSRLPGFSESAPRPQPEPERARRFIFVNPCMVRFFNRLLQVPEGVAQPMRAQNRL